MDILKILSEYHNATEEEKEQIGIKLEHDFKLLPESEQKEVQRVFLESQDALMREAMEAVRELRLKVELEHVSQYVSMSYIAKNFFGKSRQWLNNRIKGNKVNGKTAAFTSNELRQLSTALEQLGSEIRDTALRIPQ